LFFGWRRVNSWRSSGRQLERVLAEESTVALLMHPNPDPDAMACAMGVASIARKAGTETQIYYSGQISHQENRAFQTVLEQEFDRITAAGDIESLPVVLVDHNEPRGFSGCNGVEPIAVVDHHPGGGTGTEFTDVRPSYGACATIITEYLDQLGVDPEQVGENGETLLSTRLATGLLYGVQSDTNSLTRGCTPAEFDAVQFLYPAADQELLDRIANPPVSEEVLEIKARAITNRTVDSPYCVSHVGEVGNVDAIPQAADELSRLEGITAVIVLGQKDGTLHMSGRSRDDRVHMGQVLGDVVEDIPMAGAGGHSRMGGGQLSIEHMEGIGPSSGVSESQFIKRLFDGMEGNL
jgi:nanoRNase/pAp phosphatase (c-di-AMP/oligoRNAs hydrolase)